MDFILNICHGEHILRHIEPQLFIHYPRFDTHAPIPFLLVSMVLIHSIDSLYSTNSVNVYVPSENQQFRYNIARGW